MSDEPKYTLEEARQVMARRECAMHGHDFDVLQKMGGEPYMVLCSRCGRSWQLAATLADMLAQDDEEET